MQYHRNHNKEYIDNTLTNNIYPDQMSDSDTNVSNALPKRRPSVVLGTHTRSPSISFGKKTQDDHEQTLPLSMIIKLMKKGHDAKHRVRVQKLDQSMEMCGVQVAVRIRPLNKMELQNNDSVCVTVLGDGKIAVSSQFDHPREFNFDAVLSSGGTQRKAYDVSARRVLSKVLDGFNGCVFAYGQTGSGKTYTMEGMKGLPGVIPRLTKDLFRHVTDHEDATHFQVKVSYVEVYQEHLRDLLKQNGPSSSSPNRNRVHGDDIKLRENRKTKTIELVGAEIVTVDSHEEIEKLMVSCQTNIKNGTVDVHVKDQKDVDDG